MIATQPRSATPDDVPSSEPLQPCELRREERNAEDILLICGASGTALGRPGRDDAAIAANCNACPIPEALRDRRACLHLRPIRLHEAGEWQAFLSCRWFYNLRPEWQPRSLDTLCAGCPYWFPRPPAENIPRYWDETEHIRRVVVRARSRAQTVTQAEALPAPSKPPGLRQRLRGWLLGWI
jgi:hypothetical protein